MTSAISTKGQDAEEALRQYFLSLGFFVTRGVPFSFSGWEVTDIDLFLYMRKTTITRERINVDIKRKMTPKAIERIFWTKGLKEVLGFDRCIVATTDKRPATREFGLLHDVMIMDGNFLTRLTKHYTHPENKFTEEQLMAQLNNKSIVDSKLTLSSLYRLSKSRLINNLDFNGFNLFHNNVKLSIEEYIASNQKSLPALRLLYLSISFMLLTLDFKSRNLAYLEVEDRRKEIIEGIRFGEAGKKRATEILGTAVALAEKAISGNLFAKNVLQQEIDSQLNEYPAEGLAEYFSKSEVMKNLFNYSIQFHETAFLKNLPLPGQLNPELKSIMGLAVDHLKVDRKKIL